MMKRVVLFIPTLLFFILIVFLWKGLYLDPTYLPSAIHDKPLPTFSMKTLELGNKIVTENKLKGQIHLINFWATWCPPCFYEHPFLVKLSNSTGIPIMGVNYNDDSNAARQWLQEYNNPYVFNVADTQGRLGIDFGISGAPETFLVDQQGVIRLKHTGIMNQQIWQEKFVPKIANLRK